MSNIIPFDAALRRPSVSFPQHRPYLACLHKALARSRESVQELEEELATYSDEAEAEYAAFISDVLPDILKARGLR